VKSAAHLSIELGAQFTGQQVEAGLVRVQAKTFEVGMIEALKQTLSNKHESVRLLKHTTWPVKCNLIGLP
jgi:hypothetical protein